MANLMGALVGAAIDRQDGDSGIKGAIIGTVAEGAIRLVVPIIATYVVGWIVLEAIERGAKAATGGSQRKIKNVDD